MHKVAGKSPIYEANLANRRGYSFSCIVEGTMLPGLCGKYSDPFADGDILLKKNSYLNIIV